jgi:hypothetical protein
MHRLSYIAAGTFAIATSIGLLNPEGISLVVAIACGIATVYLLVRASEEDPRRREDRSPDAPPSRAQPVGCARLDDPPAPDA